MPAKNIARRRAPARPAARRGAPSPLDAALSRILSFVAEAHPDAYPRVAEAFATAAVVARRGRPGLPETLTALRKPFSAALAASRPKRADRSLAETTPGVPARVRFEQAEEALRDGCDGALAREALRASLSHEERREILRGMLLTRATDNRLKLFFTGGEVRYGRAAFQGKGFRSLGQEAIYAAAIRLRRGASWRGDDGAWRGDVVAPIIRDAGAALAMRPEPATVRMMLNGQMGKAGPPMDGKDLHIGDFGWGVMPASAPLTISSMTVAGLAMAFRLREEPRVAVSFVGEGATSLGEWHEAINLCAARKLPAIFCVENNQTALSTPVAEQSAVRVFADKAAGYGIPGVTIDGTDPDAIAAAFAWAAGRARSGEGPSLIELVAMRMCGHAHHDDMLYLGKDPHPSWEYARPSGEGYADAALFEFWAKRDPIPTYAARLVREGVIGRNDLESWKAEASEIVETEARALIEAPWPSGDEAGAGVLADEPPRRHVEPLESRASRPSRPLPSVEDAPAFDPKGRTFLEAVMLGVGDALRSDPRVFVYGEDVGGAYGNAFLLLRPLLKEFGNRILNSPIAEGGTIGVCVGAALAGMRPIGEIQFNDFVATGFNQLVNNAAKIRYRWGGSVPMVLRMPWGGLRRAGPYHSQNTEAWFYRTPGLKIVCPWTPHDARALLAAAVADPDPVLYYEHIALYREPKIKQRLDDSPPEPIPIGKAALRRAGPDLAIVSYGAYVHLAMRVAETLAAEGVECSVIDLRSLQPLDRDLVLAVARHCGKVLICHEDSRTGGLGESLAAIIQEECFEELDAPVRIVGALDAPVPYSPSLEDAFLPGEERVLRAARLLAAY
ncbi:MAG TPA: thiamine pyrophosphate-dependent enzyme [Candidatus Sulfotelmatobacter sp.]|jgi:2-oxoisovalerate dehydrogenase E1 component|nr:thiamine pyrophosphate-dependent enzyme [Candidatus Sulfotelmatobacter sp.]